SSSIQLNKYEIPASSIEKPRPFDPSSSRLSPTRIALVITGPKLGSKRRGTSFPFLRSLLLITNESRSPLTEKREPSVLGFNSGNAARFRIKRYGDPNVPAATIRRLHLIV